MLAAKQPLVVPMLLRLSHFKLNSYVVLVVSKQKGITIVFKTDPLQHVDINSTFDSIAVIQKFIQREIEGQLRQMFREDLPGIIHRLSQQWIKAKVEAPYLSKRVPRPLSLHEPISPFPPPWSLKSAPAYSVAAPSVFGVRRPRSVSGLSSSSHRSTPKPLPTPSTGAESPASFPEIENFDPTYGLRPEGLPTKSLFNNFSKLFSPSKGLAELAEPLEEVDELDEPTSFADSISNTRPSTPSDNSGNSPEYETIPAVGGGTITRPRVYLSHSQVHSPTDLTPAEPALQPPPNLRRSSSLEIAPPPRLRRPLQLRQPTLPSPVDDLQFGTFDPSHSRTSSITRSTFSRYSNPELPPLVSTPTIHPIPRRPHTRAPLPTPPPSDTHTDPGNSPRKRRQSEDRRSSISSSIPDRFDTTSPSLHGSFSPDPDPKIILRPSLNEHVFKLSTLTHSNHTLSPFTRSLEHFAVRSGPPKAPSTSGPSDRPPHVKVKAKRKRIYRVGGKKEPEQSPQPKIPPAPASDFDESDMDRYFKWRDEVEQHQQFDPNFQPHPPDELSSTEFTPQPHPSQLRKRYLQQSHPL